MLFAPTIPQDTSAAKLAEIRKALRREQRKRRRLQGRDELRYGLTDETLLFCATIKELAPDEPHIARWAAVRSLDDASKPEGCVRCCLIDDLIEEWRHEHSHMVRMQVDGNATDSHRRQRAADLIAQHRLMSWVYQVNLTNGIAPSSDQMLQRFRESWSFHDEPDLTNMAEKLTEGSPSGARRWLTDFRRRFGITFGKLPPGCDLSAEEIQNQVFGTKMGSKNEPICGTHFWVPKRRPKTWGTHFQAQKWYPFLGTTKHQSGTTCGCIFGAHGRPDCFGHGLTI